MKRTWGAALGRKLRSVVVAGALVAAGGCGDAGPQSGATHDHDHGQEPAHAPAEGNGHKHGSQHGGVAVELGEHQYHLDFLHDPATGTLTAWVMDAHAENFVRIAAGSIPLSVTVGDAKQALVLSAVANPSTGETVGDTSQFRGEAAWLKGVTSFRAVVDDLEIRGTRFQAVPFRYPAGR